MDAYCTLQAKGGQPIACTSVRVTLPRIGVWTAVVVLAQPTPPAGKVTLSLAYGAMLLKGTVRFGGTAMGEGSALIVGGAGGLTAAVKPKHYQGLQFKSILTDWLTQAGETLSSRCDAVELARVLQNYVVLAGSLGETLQVYLDTRDAGLAWRILTDGTFWLGEETFPAVGVPVDVLEQMPGDNRLLLDVSQPVFTPGITFSGLPVSLVEYYFDAHRRHCALTFEDAAS